MVIFILFLGVFSYLNFIPHIGESNHIENRSEKFDASVHVKLKDKNRWVKGGRKTVFFNLFRTKKAEEREIFLFRDDISEETDSIRFRFDYNTIRKEANLSNGQQFEIKNYAPFFKYSDTKIFGKVVTIWFKEYYQITVSAEPIRNQNPNNQNHLHGHLCSPTETCDPVIGLVSLD